MRPGMTRLRTFPGDRLIDEPLCRIRTSELSLYQSVGDPTGMTDPVDPEPRLYWDLEWSCGMVMALAFHQLNEILHIQLDLADVPHALRHLSVEAYDMQLLRLDDPELFAKVCVPLPTDWELWRVNRDGSEGCYKWGLSRRNADCWAREAEEITGRRYWVQRSITPTP